MGTRGNFLVDTDDFTTTLKFRNITMDDQGEYEVVVKNEWGVTREKFTVKVVGEYWRIYNLC